MSTFLVLRQIGEVFPALLLPNAVHVEFLQVVPVFESERRFKIVHGAEALLQRWEATGLQFWNPRRRAEPAA
jgi:hypothetical protein